MTSKKKDELSVDDIPNDLIDQLIANYEKPEDILGKDGLIKKLTKKIKKSDNYPETYR